MQAGSPLRLEIEAGPNPLRSFEYVEVVLTVSNVGASTIDPVLELGIGEYVGCDQPELRVPRRRLHGLAGTANTVCDPIERVQLGPRAARAG